MTPSPQKSLALLFPGQGSQRPSMGEKLILAQGDRFLKAVEEIMQAKVFTLLKDADRLVQTQYAQPMIFLVCALGYRHWASQQEDRQNCFFAGHSLGEYTALYSAGVFDLFEGLAVVKKRGELMHKAAQAHPDGAMLAVIGKGCYSFIREKQADPSRWASYQIDIANINSPEQVVLSGRRKDLEKWKENVGGEFKGRFVFLKVSSAFHSRYMKPAQEAFHTFLEKRVSRWNISHCTTVLSNFTGTFHEEEKLVDHLSQQIVSAVRWIENIQTLQKKADHFIEIGPARILTSFFKAIAPEKSHTIQYIPL